MSSVHTRSDAMKKYGLIPDTNDIFDRRKQTLLIQHQQKMASIQQIANSVRKKYIEVKNQKINHDLQEEKNLRQLTLDLNITFDTSKDVIVSRQQSYKQNGHYYEEKYSKDHTLIKSQGFISGLRFLGKNQKGSQSERLENINKHTGSLLDKKRSTAASFRIKTGINSIKAMNFF